MAIQLSQRLKVYVLGAAAANASLQTVWTGASDHFDMKIFSGSVPATPETAIAAGTLAEFTTLYFADAVYNATYGNVILAKTTAAWTAAASAAGVASFFRIYDSATPTDDGVVDDTVALNKPRIQGTIGTTAGFDLVMTDTNIASGQSITIDTFNIILF